MDALGCISSLTDFYIWGKNPYGIFSTSTRLYSFMKAFAAPMRVKSLRVPWVIGIPCCLLKSQEGMKQRKEGNYEAIKGRPRPVRGASGRVPEFQ